MDKLIEIDIDPIKSGESVIVLKVLKIKDGIGGKFIWDKVKIIDEIKNDLNLLLPKEIEIAHYSFKKGLPNEACIVYLTYFPLGTKESNSESYGKWVLLKGDGDYGVQKTKK